MLAATFLAIFFIPWFFKMISDRKLSDERSTSEIEGEVEHHRSLGRRAARTAHHRPLAKEGEDED
jgi:HAE1 family hydrophobic/amphiphilic exporter-1/multidrug efflux pump